MSTRPAAVANLFYPGDPEVLRNTIQHYLAAVTPVPTATPKAIIVPHAGYIYSGLVAAHAYAQLLPIRSQITRVVLLGPCHRVAVEGLAVPGVDYFETPLGKIPLDHAAIDEILQLPQVHEFDLTHEQEHSLEVQLPFLQETLDQFTIVPVVVGDASNAAVQQVIDTLWGGDETLIVISSDLSHYHDYATARAIDSATCRAIENFDASSIQYENACGRKPVIALLGSAQARHMHVTTLDLRNSGDTAGDKSRVVGYGAWMFE
jgi:AmmeMemoRadiSam system protein B